MGVDTGGAGDQGMMFGYAVNENEELMPTPISLAHKLTMRLSQVRKSGKLPFLRPDGKSQVTVEYDANGKVLRVDAVVISTQHSETVANDELRSSILKHVNQLGVTLAELEALKLHASESQRMAIEHARPHLDSVAQSTTQAFELIKDNRGSIHFPQYGEAVSDIYEHAKLVSLL